MKKILGIVLLGLLWCNMSFAAEYDGKGELKLSNHAVKYFIIYIRGTSNTPGTFYVTEDGRDVYYWTCPYGQCQPAAKGYESKKCSLAYDKECKLFAQRRTVKWKNGINAGKGKASRFSSKMTDAEIRAKLTQLGFLGDTTSATPKVETKKKKTMIKKKEPKKDTDSTSELTKELKELKKLYDEGILTEEEFTKAKKKLLD